MDGDGAQARARGRRAGCGARSRRGWRSGRCRTSRRPQPSRNSGWPASTSWPDWTSTAAMTQSRSARIWLNTFIASITQSDLSGRDGLPGSDERRRARRLLQMHDRRTAAPRSCSRLRRCALGGARRGGAAGVRRRSRPAGARRREPAAVPRLTSRSVSPLLLYSSSARSEAASASISCLDKVPVHAHTPAYAACSRRLRAHGAAAIRRIGFAAIGARLWRAGIAAVRAAKPRSPRQTRRPARAGSSWTISAGSDKGRWSDWQSVSGASITGLTMRRHQDGRSPATSRAMDAGQDRRPQPVGDHRLESHRRFHFGHDPEARSPARMKFSSTSLRTMLYGRGRNSSMPSNLGNRDRIGAGRRADQEQLLLQQRHEAQTVHGPVPVEHGQIHAAVHDQLRQRRPVILVQIEA